MVNFHSTDYENASFDKQLKARGTPKFLARFSSKAFQDQSLVKSVTHPTKKLIQDISEQMWF